MTQQVEEFQINKKFAKTFTEYRKKEEYEKLKHKYGKVKLKDLKSQHAESSGEDGDSAHEKSYSGDSDSSDSSDTSSLDEEFIDREKEEFMVLIDALEKNDPALKEKNRKWFSDPPKKKSNLKKNGHEPLNLKDYERKILLEDGKFEDEEAIALNERLKKIDSDELLAKLKQDTVSDKAAFLESVSKAEEEAKLREENPEEEEEEFEPEKPGLEVIDEAERKKRLKKIDISKWKLTATGKPEDEQFLLNYLLNHNKKKKSNPVKTVTPTEISASDAKKKKEKKSVAMSDWLIKKESAEESNSEEELNDEPSKKNSVNIRQEHLSQSESDVSEEESDKIPKSYPRKIEDTYRQSDAKSRSDKRKERELRKKEEKEAKMKELQTLKDMKLQEFQEKIDKIKKISGLENKDAGDEDEEKRSKKIEKRLLKLIDEEADWDPDLHDKILAKIFGEGFYEEADPGIPEDEEKPVFADLSDFEGDSKVLPPTVDYDNINPEELRENPDSEADEEMNEEESNKDSKSKRRRRKKKQSTFSVAVKKNRDKYDPEKYPDFDEYFNKFYKLSCEDIINGQKPGEDIYCRFKYRSVKPNDFGLTTEEILNADEKELNKWVSVKRMSQYRQDEDEDYDYKKFHSNPENIEWKKKKILKSLYEEEEGPDQSQKIDEETEEGSRKRKREEYTSKKSLNCPIDEERLLAAGLDKKQIKAAKWKMNQEKKAKHN